MKKCFLYIFLLAFCFVFPDAAFSVPAAPFIKKIKLPDGQTINVRLIGDERISWFESEEGYTLVKNEYGFFEFAILDRNGDISSSGIIYGYTPPPVKKHLRPIPDIIMTAQKKVRREAKLKTLAPSITGSGKVLVILIEYTDLKHTSPMHEKSFYDNLYFGSLTGSVNNYFKAISYDKLSIVGSSAGWYTSKFDRAYYGVKDINNPDVNPSRELVIEAVKAADTGGINFADYDQDSDGYVDHLAVIHAGSDAAVSYDPNDIWSHSWQLAAAYQTGSGIYVKDYVIIAEESRLGTHAHELLHDFGAPDLYDIGYVGVPIRDWCIMAYGMYGGTPAGSVPVHLCGYLKSDLDADPLNGQNGWLDTYNIVSVKNGRYNVTQLENSSGNRVYRINIQSGNEYFLIENRQLTGYDASLPESGLLIFHVDENMPDIVSSYINHGDNTFYRIAVEDPGSMPNHFDAAFSLDDFQTEFGSASLPSTNSNTGQTSNVNISNISASQQNMTFDLIYNGLTPNEFPVPTLSASTVSGDPPLYVSFTGSATDSDGSIISYYYDFGDGQTSSEQNPSHTFTSSGNYTVTLTATDDRGAVGMTATSISVTGGKLNTNPIVSLSAKPVTGKAPLIVTFTSSAQDEDGFIASYNYDFGDGYSASLQNPVHIYDTAGEFTATLTVSDNDGGISSSQVIIRVGSSSGGGGGGCGTLKGPDIMPPTSAQIAFDLFLLLLPAFFVIRKRAFIRVK